MIRNLLKFNNVQFFKVRTNAIDKSEMEALTVRSSAIKHVFKLTITCV